MGSARAPFITGCLYAPKDEPTLSLQGAVAGLRPLYLPRQALICPWCHPRGVYEIQTLPCWEELRQGLPAELSR